MGVFLALILILAFYLIGVLLSAILIISSFSVIRFINKKLNIPYKTLIDLFWFSEDASIMDELYNSWFSWISFIGIIVMTASTVVVAGCKGLIKTINNKMITKGIWCGLGFKELFYKMYIPLTPSESQKSYIGVFDDIKDKNIETHSFLTFVSVVPYKNNKVLILINNSAWRFLLNDIYLSLNTNEEVEQFLNDIEMEIRFRKLKKLHI